MIEGVVIRDLAVHADEHGYLYEILREDWPEFKHFGQAYLTVTYPGVIKGWHYHNLQSDHFCIIKGMGKIVLYDDLPDSPTRHELMEICFGEFRQKLLVFPPKILHGIIALNDEPLWILNFPDYKYNPEEPDEHRIPWDTPIKRKNGTTAPYEWFRNTESEDLK
jgi:dTDP-4-dehydrorhamnose 3,5-epimerase